MGTRLTFSFYGDKQLDRTLARMADNIGDARPVWNVLADRFVALERRQFSSEGGHASGGWAPLSEKYGEWKHAHYPGKKILELTGDLKDSLTRRPLGVEVLEPGFMVIGSNVDYGAYHQHGNPAGNLPQRRPVEFTEHARRDWVRRVQRFIVTGEAR